MVYDQSALGAPLLVLLEPRATVVRRDFEVTNARGQLLHCSLWERPVAVAEDWDRGQASPCVLYLHGNSSSRAEAVKTQVLKAALAAGAGGVAAFDFAGCGRSSGEYVSLGWFESQDCALVVRELREKHGVGPVVLWGRSMGAVTALLYATTGGSAPAAAGGATTGEGQAPRRRRGRGHGRHRHAILPADPPPAGLILDSPFSSFQQLAVDLTTEGLVRIPRLAVAAVLGLLRRSVRRRAGFDLYDVKPLAHLHRAAGAGVPALFLVAEQDELIPPWQGEALEARWPGPKLGLRFRGTHNSARPPIVYALASAFIRGAGVRAREHPLAVAMALRLVERTAVVASQEEEQAAARAAQEDEDEDEDEALRLDLDAAAGRRERRRRRQRERQHPSVFRYGDGADEEAAAGGKKKSSAPPPAPRFVRAGSDGSSRSSMANLHGVTQGLIAALDCNLAARAVEEYLLEEVLRVGVALVASDLRQAAAAAAGPGAGAGTQQGQQRQQSKVSRAGSRMHGFLWTSILNLYTSPSSSDTPQPLLLDEVVRAQKDFAASLAAAPSSSSSVPPALRATAATILSSSSSSSSGSRPTTWEGVLGKAQKEEKEATALALAGLRGAAAAVQRPPQLLFEVEAAPRKPQQQGARWVAPTQSEAAPAASSPTPLFLGAGAGPRFCCFDPNDAFLSAAAAEASTPAAVKQARLAAVAEAVFADA